MARTPTNQVEPSDTQTQQIIRSCQTDQEMLFNQYNMRASMEDVDRAYMREADWTTAQLNARMRNSVGDKNAIQNITMPIVKPQVDAGISYLSEVFLSGYPIFDVNSTPENEQQARMLSTIVAEQSITAGWSRQILMAFRDGLKYNLMALECSWDQKVTTSIQNDITSPGSTSSKQTIWQGNTLKRMDLYNTFWDPRVHPAEVHTEGEYAGYHTLMSRSRFKKFCNSLYDTVSPGVITKALASSSQTQWISNNGVYGYYTPLINPNPMVDRTNSNFGMDWMQWAGLEQFNTSMANYGTNIYLVTIEYKRIIPADFGFNVPSPNSPQVWKFTIINGNVILKAERLTNAHDFIPIIFGQPIEDGLDYQTKSFAQSVMPEQDTASSLMNGYMASKRRLVGDRVLFDPMRIREKDINSTNPAAKIPVRNGAFGKPLNEAVFPFPYRDEAVQTMLDGAMRINALSQTVNSINPAQQGQFVKGNKTKQEYDDTMGHGNGPFRVMAILLEAQTFTPLKEIIKLNILQYSQNQVITDHQTGEQVQVDMVQLRSTALNFSVSDGQLPTDKLMSSDDWTVAMQTIGSSPQIAQEYNMGDMFSYIMAQRDVDLTPFQKPKEQMQYEQAMQAWQQAAAMAAQKGTTFNSPQPTPPAPPPQPGSTPTTTPGAAPLATGPTGQAPAPVVNAAAAQAMQQNAQGGPGQQQAQPAPNGPAARLPTSQGTRK